MGCPAPVLTLEVGLQDSIPATVESRGGRQAFGQSSSLLWEGIKSLHWP